MEENSVKRFDLGDRALRFSRSLIQFTKACPSSIQNDVVIRQLVRSGTAVGANYIEANEALGKKDFVMRVRIARKEAKETIYWLELIETSPDHEDERVRLLDEAGQLLKILSAIIKKCF